MKAKWNLTGDFGVLTSIVMEMCMDDIHLVYMMCVNRFCGVLRGFGSWEFCYGSADFGQLIGANFDRIPRPVCVDLWHELYTVSSVLK